MHKYFLFTAWCTRYRATVLWQNVFALHNKGRFSLAFFIMIIIHLISFRIGGCFLEMNYCKILVDIRLDGNFSLEFRTLLRKTNFLKLKFKVNVVPFNKKCYVENVVLS